MTTTSTFASLSLPAIDDTMEVSSPANRAYDEDIDLDFGDDLAGGVPLADDEHMLTDSENTRPATATDDIMNDEPAGVMVPEEIMDDDLTLVEPDHAHDGDEELIDYSDDELEDQPHVLEDPAAEHVQEYAIVDEQPTEIFEQVDDDIVQQPEDPPTEQPEFEESASFLDSADDHHDFVAASDFAQVHGEAEDGPDAQHEEQGQASYEHHDHVGDSTAQTDQSTVDLLEYADQPGEGDEHYDQPDLTVDTAVNAANDGPATPTDTGLHPMLVNYGDMQMPLFKSKRQPEGLLKDDNLASLSLAQLLQNCRQRMAIKIGEIADENELVLSFDNLYLRLGEVRGPQRRYVCTALTVTQDSRAAFESSLNDILEIYLHLHQNDDTQDVPPFSLTLSVQPKFTSSLALLRQAAASGQGMQPFNLMHQNEDVEEYYEEEDGVENAAEHGGAGEESYEEQAGTEDHAEGDDEDAQDEQNNQYQGELEGGEAREQEAEGTENEHEQDIEGQEYTNEEEYGDEDASTNTAEHAVASAEEALGDGSAQLHDDQQTGQADVGSYPAQPDADAQDDPYAEISFVDGTDEEVTKAASTASSTTIQGDQPHDSVGEYSEEDLIDWDDEEHSLTSNSSEPTANGPDDYSTFLEEIEAAEGTSGQHGVEPKTADEHAEAAEAQLAADESLHFQDPKTAAEKHEALHAPGAEDFLNDFEEQEYPNDAEYGEDAQPHFQEQDYAQEEYYDQADTYEEQQGGQQPGEDDEQFHTAHGFSEEDLYEHGPEHDAFQDGETTGYEENGLVDPFEHVTDHHDQAEDHFDQPTTEAQVPLDPDDDIGFDDETTEQHEARKASQPDISAVGSGSPLGKRSFDDLVETDDFDDGEPELKKARSG